MRINELIVENNQIDEGIGSALGKAWGGTMRGIGALGGGIAGSWDAMKQGYKAGRSTVAGTDQPDSGTQGGQAQGGGQAVGGQTAPSGQAQSGGQAGVSQDKINTGLAAIKSNLPNDSDDDIKDAMAHLQSLGKGKGDPFYDQYQAELDKRAQASGASGSTDAGAAGSAGTMSLDQINKVIPTLAKSDLENVKKTVDDLIAKGGSAAPAGGAAPQPSTKMSAKDQNALKARLKGQKQAGTSVAGQTGTGFKDYVAGSRTNLVGADKQGNPVFQKLQRESIFVESVHYSKFLGAHI